MPMTVWRRHCNRYASQHSGVLSSHSLHCGGPFANFKQVRMNLLAQEKLSVEHSSGVFVQVRHGHFPATHHRYQEPSSRLKHFETTVKEIVPQRGPRDYHLLPREVRADAGNRRDGKSLQPLNPLNPTATRADRSRIGCLCPDCFGPRSHRHDRR
jgi:hypothetical protein